MFGANLIYGANYSIAKIALNGWIPPFAFIVIRVLVALGLFVVFHRLFIREKVLRKDMPLLALCGMFGVAINQLCFFKGLSMTSGIHASLIMITTPLLVLLFASVTGREQITVRKAIGILIGAVGLVWLVVQGAGPLSDTASVTGDLYILVNAASYGIYLALAKPLMQRYHPITVVKWVFFFGMFAVVPVGAGELNQVNWGELPPVVWGSVIFVLLGATFLAYLFNTMALRDVNASVVSIYIYTQPLIASLIAVVFGAESVHWSMLGSGLLIGTGVWLVSRPGIAWTRSLTGSSMASQKP